MHLKRLNQYFYVSTHPLLAKCFPGPGHRAHPPPPPWEVCPFQQRGVGGGLPEHCFVLYFSSLTLPVVWAKDSLPL